MRASSPRLVALAAAALCSSVLALAASADPILITIRASDEHAMHHPSAAEVSVNASAVRAAAEAYAASELPDGVMGASDALAAARAAGLEDGVAPWRAVLDFSWAHGAIVWRVANTTAQETGNASGRRLTLDAKTLEILDRDRWHAIVG